MVHPAGEELECREPVNAGRGASVAVGDEFDLGTMLFAQSPIRRAGRDGFLRNVCVALGNRGELDAAPALMRALERDPDALVRAHPAWALGERGRKLQESQGLREVSEALHEALERAAIGDTDESVREDAAATAGFGS